MKPLVCEMCDSHDVVKQNGMFVCQHCGTKYSVEEAKKMMVEGTVKIDNSDKHNNLYHLARRARLENDEVNAAKYYSLVLEDDPKNWEASFYSVYYSAIQTNIAGISSAAYRIAKCVPTTLLLIKESIKNTDDIRNAVAAVVGSVHDAATALFGGAMSHYKQFPNVSNANNEKIERVNSIIAMLFITGNTIEAMFGDDTKLCASTACECWKTGFTCYESCNMPAPSGAEEHIEKIRKYEPSYVCRKAFTNTGGGCYIATAIYGSYDCPEVWTLRRYRDYTLAETWHGRLFIRFYYAISPYLVRWFGHTKCFQLCFKPMLNKMVMSLQEKGFKSTPYRDISW